MPAATRAASPCAHPAHNRSVAKRILLARIPDGVPRESDFRLESVPDPPCPEGGILVKTQFLSVDPYLRGRISGRRTYIDPIPAGSPMISGAVGEVVESRREGFHAGDMVAGLWDWQDLAAVPNLHMLMKIDPAEAPPSTAIGVLGVPGITAYFGMTELCAPKAGETVLVSGAAGAVGSIAGQIAALQGCRVVGTAGSDEKCEWLRGIGFTSALNYRAEPPDSLRKLCPDGIDCYFDNTGGPITDTALDLMNTRGRIAVCGQIAHYNGQAKDIGPRPYTTMVVRQLRMEGFLVFRWMPRWPEARAALLGWLRQGRLHYRETVYEGLESAPRAFIGLFSGDNTGKAVVRLG